MRQKKKVKRASATKPRPEDGQKVSPNDLNLSALQHNDSFNTSQYTYYTERTDLGINDGAANDEVANDERQLDNLPVDQFKTGLKNASSQSFNVQVLADLETVDADKISLASDTKQKPVEIVVTSLTSEMNIDNLPATQTPKESQVMQPGETPTTLSDNFDGKEADDAEEVKQDVTALKQDTQAVKTAVEEKKTNATEGIQAEKEKIQDDKVNTPHTINEDETKVQQQIEEKNANDNGVVTPIEDKADKPIEEELAVEEESKVQMHQKELLVEVEDCKQQPVQQDIEDKASEVKQFPKHNAAVSSNSNAASKVDEPTKQKIMFGVVAGVGIALCATFFFMRRR